MRTALACTPQCVVAHISASNSKGCAATRLINAILQENHLAFPGFQFDSPVMNAYRLRAPDDRARINLDHWNVCEREYPNTSFGMHQGWM